ELPTLALSSLSLHDALPIYRSFREAVERLARDLDRLAELHHSDAVASVAVTGRLDGHTELKRLVRRVRRRRAQIVVHTRAPQQISEEHTSELQSRENLVCRL